MKKVLIFKGGWDGHQPDLTSVRFARLMEAEGYEAEISDTLDCLADAENWRNMRLSLPAGPWEKFRTSM